MPNHVPKLTPWYYQVFIRTKQQGGSVKAGGSVKTGGSVKAGSTREHDPRLSFGMGTTITPHSSPHEPRHNITPGPSFIPRTSFTPRTTPRVKIDSLAPEIRNKVPWKDHPWVVYEESEISKSELVSPMPSGKAASTAPGK